MLGLPFVFLVEDFTGDDQADHVVGVQRHWTFDGFLAGCLEEAAQFPQRLGLQGEVVPRLRALEVAIDDLHLELKVRLTGISTFFFRDVHDLETVNILRQESSSAFSTDARKINFDQALPFLRCHDVIPL